MSEFLKRIAEFSPKRLLLLAAELEERVRALEAGNLEAANIENRRHAPIAIIGMGCRFPGGVEDAESFWDLLMEGRDAVTEVPASRWNVERLYDPDPLIKGKVASKWGGFVDGVELFDPAFFGIAPVEAVSIDPQQRLLLEVTWEALEDAGIVPASLNGSRTGVYVGICNTDYGQIALRQAPERLDAYSATGGAHAVASGRISYFLGLRGPSLAIDTACSASLVTVHAACQSLRLGETELALAGGVNLVLTPDVTIGMSRGQLMARDGRCKAFSATADGYVRSEGCGMVVLKRLDDALRDGDRVLGVIRGSAVNQDGRSSGLTAPNGPAQEEVIRAALEDAGVAAQAVGYVEAHGTGTSLGDTIEMQALGATLGAGRAEDARLVVGSVKSNIGHTESAAGVAGLMKVTLALGRGVIPASLHCAAPNPAIDWERHRTRVPVTAEPWRSAGRDGLRIAGVSSFGFSGTNAHAIVSEAPAVADASADAKDREVQEAAASQVIVLSARSERALASMAGRLAVRLRKRPELRLADVAFTLSAGRTAFAHRAALRAGSRELLIEELDLLAAGEECGFLRGVVDGGAARVVFLFAGQGGERAGMGLSLLARSEVFCAAVAEVDAALVGVIGPFGETIPAIETIWRNTHGELAQSAYVQPALFAFQYGLARVWQSWGVEPQVVLGHSMGEIVAAALAGVMGVGDAARLVAMRGRLTGELGDAGGMVAINAGEAQVQAVLKSYAADVSIAAINGAARVVISGRAEAVERAAQEFERAGVRVKRLNITYGSHSPAMARVLAPFYEEAAKIRYNAPRIPMIADMTGELVEDDSVASSVFDARYWSEHLSQPVQFVRCLERLEGEDCGLCIEMGPRAVLTAFGRERGESETRWVASADGREDDFDALQRALAEAFVAGAALDWEAVYRGQAVRKVALPAYPFERERYWIAEHEAGLRRMEFAERASCAAGVRLDAALPIFELTMAEPLPFDLGDYRVGGQVMVPVGVYVAWARSAAAAAMESSDAKAEAWRVRGLTLHALLRPVAGVTRVQTMLMPLDGDGEWRFRVSARHGGDGPWTLYASGEIELVSALNLDAEQQNDASVLGRDAMRESSAAMSAAEFYGRLAAQGMEVGAGYRAVEEVWLRPGGALGRVHAGATQQEVDGQRPVGWASCSPTLSAKDAERMGHPSGNDLRPKLLEACLNVVGMAALAEGDGEPRMMTGIRELVLMGPLHGELWVDAQIERAGDGALEGRLTVRGEQGEAVGWVHGIALRPFGVGAMNAGAAGVEEEAGRGEDAAAAWRKEPAESRVMALERAVGKEAARVLGMRRGQLPDGDARLADLGMDSLMAVVLRNRLQAMVGYGLPPTFAFEHPTPAEMALALDLLLWSHGVAGEEQDAAERDEIQI